MESNLIKKIAATFELTGATLSEGAIDMVITQLSGFESSSVSVALDKCLNEVKGRLTPAHIIERIDDGRPGVEEAWNMIPKNEDETVVWTSEISEAYGACYSLLNDGDTIGARMAFKEKYEAILSDSRASGKPVSWSASLGSPAGRECVLKSAVESGKLSYRAAVAMLTERRFSGDAPKVLERGPDAKLAKILNGIGE